MNKGGYQSLTVWQKAIELTKEVYAAAEALPINERFALADQIRRAAVSVPSNIAEGSRRGSKKENIHILNIARGSLAELETQLLLASDIYKIDRFRDLLSLADEIGRMLFGLIKTLKG